jgi:peptidoglycan/LPS O-acetylase OafA/YrhL
VKRLECLDGLRGVLALYVLLSHLLPFAALPAWVQWPLSHGEAAVDMFFVLSGLVIVRSLERFNYRARPFLIARAARIFPVFLLVFVLAVAVQPLAIDFGHMTWIGPDSAARQIWSDGWPAAWLAELAAHLTMVHGLFPDGVLPDAWVSFLGASWSLSTEWQFYALVAMIGARFGRGEGGRWRLVLLLLGLVSSGRRRCRWIGGSVERSCRTRRCISRSAWPARSWWTMRARGGGSWQCWGRCLRCVWRMAIR